MYNGNLLRHSKLSIAVSLVASALSSFSLNLIPLIPGLDGEGNNIISYMVAITFWLGMLITFVAAYLTKRILYRTRKKLIARRYNQKRQLIGIISFSGKWYMLLLYVFTLAGIVLSVTDIFLGYLPEKLLFPILSVTVWLFTVHCVVDGKYYKAYRIIKESVKNETNR